MNLKEASIKDNIQESRFELQLEDETAIVDYSDEGKKVILIHTEVPDALEGKGVGATLMGKTFEYLEQQGKKIIPACSYVRKLLEKHPEWERMIA